MFVCVCHVHVYNQINGAINFFKTKIYSTIFRNKTVSNDQEDKSAKRSIRNIYSSSVRHITLYRQNIRLSMVINDTRWCGSKPR